MKFIDNITSTVKRDMETTITKDSRTSIAASYFSIFAFEALKKELRNISELRFIFISPTFVSEKAAKEKQEFYIPRLGRERNLYGIEFEVKLRNELSQRAIAKECAEWIKAKVRFKSNTTTSTIPDFLHFDAENKFVYQPLNSFTTTSLGCEKGNDLGAYKKVMNLNFENLTSSPRGKGLI